MTVWIKQGVMGYLSPPMRRCKGWLIREYEKKGKDFYITSIGEGNHHSASCHYEGDAIDFKRQGFLRSHIITICGNNFDVVEYNDKDIFHVEYDPK